MLFNRKTGGAKIRTPDSFQQKARHDIESRVESLANSPQSHSQSSTILNKFKTRASGYAASPLGRTVTTIESSDDCSTIDSGKSGKSLSPHSIHKLIHQQQTTLSRIHSATTGMSAASTGIFDGHQLQSIYTNSTAPTTFTASEGMIPLNAVLPKDFTDYYSPDLDVPKFSNGRPRYTKRDLRHWELNDTRSLLIFPELNPQWEGKIPQIQSHIQGKTFRIQIIPIYIPDEQIVESLARSDIYKEAKFDHEFRLKTATFIVQKARIRHQQVLVSSFNIQPQYFNENHLIGNLEYDCYFKFEWRNIIENFLLNLAIEYQCRTDYKSKIHNLIGANNEKRRKLGLPIDQDGDVQMSSKPIDSLYKKTLIRQGIELNDDMKAEIWKEVQNKVYSSLDDDTQW